MSNSHSHSKMLTISQLASACRLETTLEQDDSISCLHNVQPEQDPSLLLSVVLLVEQIMATDQPAYRKVLTWYARTSTGYVRSHWFRKLEGKFKIHHLVRSPHQSYHCTAEIIAFFEAIDELNLTASNLSLPLDMVICDEKTGLCVTIAEKTNQLFNLIRLKMNSPVARQTLLKRARKAKAHFKSGSKYIRRLLEVYARLLVLRVDLLYRKEFAKEIDLTQLNTDISHFLNNMRSNQIFKGLKGYLFKTEQGFESNLHVHCMFFFDGSVRQSDSFIAQQIGKYWSNTITKGKGRFYNCNLSKHQYKYCGIGMLRYDDHDKLDALIKCLAYLTKLEQCISFTDQSNYQVFRRGEMLPLSNLGRPRTVNPL